MPDWWNSPVTWGHVVIIGAVSVVLSILGNVAILLLRRAIARQAERDRHGDPTPFEKP